MSFRIARDRSRRFLATAGTLMFLSICGCNRGPDLTFVPVSGQVMFGDAPLAESVVIFAPLEGTGGRFSSGRTDKDGKYALEADIGGGETTEGAVPGEYRVGFIRRRTPDGKPIVFDPNAEVGPMAGSINDLPRKYWTMNSELKVTVKADGTNVHDFKLDTEEGRGTEQSAAERYRRSMGNDEVPPQPGGMRRGQKK